MVKPIAPNLFLNYSRFSVSVHHVAQGDQKNNTRYYFLYNLIRVFLFSTKLWKGESSSFHFFISFKMPMSRKLQELWNELYEKKGQGWMTVFSGSMSPILKIGDKVLVKYISPKWIHFGDIIVFKENDKFIVHRVIRKRLSRDKLIFLEKGDNNRFASWIDAEKVIGKAIAVNKGDRYIRLDSFSEKCRNFLKAIKSNLF